MDYVCENMKRLVIYDQDTISVTLERCDQCVGCLRSRAEAPVDTCEALAERSKILAQPGFERAKVVWFFQKETEVHFCTPK